MTGYKLNPAFITNLVFSCGYVNKVKRKTVQSSYAYCLHGSLNKQLSYVLACGTCDYLYLTEKHD